MGCQKGVMLTAYNKKKHRKRMLGPVTFWGGWRWLGGGFGVVVGGQVFFEALTVGGKEAVIRLGFAWLIFKQMHGVWHSVQNGLRDVGFGIGKDTHL